MSADSNLPSYSSALDFLRKPSPQSTTDVLVAIVGRAAILGFGFVLTGEKPKVAAKNAVIGSAAIEIFVMLYAADSLTGRNTPK